MPGLTTTNRFLYCCRDYFNTLEVVCERGPKENYGLLNWTVAEETDDVVYYQSYTHEVSLFLTYEEEKIFSLRNTKQHSTIVNVGDLLISTTF